jgi:hypothetical protein
MAEGRKEPRSRTLKSGKIVIGSSAVIDCTIRDLSRSGARLKVDGAFTLPEELRRQVEYVLKGLDQTSGSEEVLPIPECGSASSDPAALQLAQYDGVGRQFRHLRGRYSGGQRLKVGHGRGICLHNGSQCDDVLRQHQAVRGGNVGRRALRRPDLRLCGSKATLRRG